MMQQWERSQQLWHSVDGIQDGVVNTLRFYKFANTPHFAIRDNTVYGKRRITVALLGGNHGCDALPPGADCSAISYPAHCADVVGWRRERAAGYAVDAAAARARPPRHRTSSSAACWRRLKSL